MEEDWKITAVEVDLWCQSKYFNFQRDFIKPSRINYNDKKEKENDSTELYLSFRFPWKKISGCFDWYFLLRRWNNCLKSASVLSKWHTHSCQLCDMSYCMCESDWPGHYHAILLVMVVWPCDGLVAQFLLWLSRVIAIFELLFSFSWSWQYLSSTSRPTLMINRLKHSWKYSSRFTSIINYRKNTRWDNEN